MELLREAIAADGLAVALRVRHPEVAFDVLLRRGALLLTDDHDRAAAELGDPGDDRRIVAEPAIPVELLEAVEHPADHVEGMRPPDVPRGLHGLPRGGPLSGVCGRVGDESRVDGEVPVPFRAGAA